MKRAYVAATLGFFVLIADQLSKYFTQNLLPLMAGPYPYKGVPVFKNFLGVEFSIVHATNKGAAWGIFAEYQDLLIVLRILLVIALFAYLFFYNKTKTYTIPLTLVTVGALSNIIDYFVYGHVIDMLHFVLWGYDFPVFNVADSFICIGVFWLFLASLFEEA